MKTSSYTLRTLASSTWELVHPLTLLVEIWEDEYLVSWPEVEALGRGETLEEALVAFQEDLVWLHEELQRMPESSLGRDPQAWKQILSQTLRKKGVAS